MHSSFAPIQILPPFCSILNESIFQKQWTSFLLKLSRKINLLARVIKELSKTAFPKLKIIKKVSINLYLFLLLYKHSINAHLIYRVNQIICNKNKTRRKLYGLTYDKLFSQSRIVKGNNSLKEPRARAPIATSQGFVVELWNIQALPENPRSCNCHMLIIKWRFW